MATPFDGITLNKATRLLPALTRGQAQNEKFVVEKDHWQAGAGYIGPCPQPSERGYTEFMAELSRIFIATDAILEIVENRRDGVVGKEPNWSWTPRRPMKKGEKPTEEEQKLIDQANAVSTTWWNEQGVHQLLRDAVFTLLWAQRAGLRMYVPSGLKLQEVVKNGQTGEETTSAPFVEAQDYDAALSYVYLDHPHPQSMAVVQDPDTKLDIGVYRFTRSQSVLRQGDGKVYVEVTYYDPDIKKTRLLVIGSAQNQEGGQTDNLDIGKNRLTMYEMRHPEFITEQIRRMQKALNFALLLLPHNLGTSAFVERTLLNAQMPGEWEYNESGAKIPGTFKPSPYKVGASTTNFVRGIEVESTNADGSVETKLTTPTIDRRDPAPVTPVVEGKEDLRHELFRMARQEHLASKGDAEASGTAYEQRRAAFISSLNETAAPVVTAVSWTVETAMAMAEDIMGEPGHFTNTLRVDCSLRLDKGPVLADEQRANFEAADAGDLPLTEALSRNGVDDPDAALLEIASQPWTQIKRETDLAAMVAAWTTAGASLEGALSRVKKLFPNLTDAEIKDLLGGDNQQQTGVSDPVVNQ